MTKMNKDFNLLMNVLKNGPMHTPVNHFLEQIETDELVKGIHSTDFETLLSFFCCMYKTYNDKLIGLKEYLDATDGQIDNVIIKSLFESQNHTLSTLRDWIKVLCEKVLNYYDVANEQNDEKLVSLVVSDGIQQLKRYVGSKKTQGNDTIEILKAQKDIENSKILPDSKMDETLAELKVSFTGLERYFSRIASQDFHIEPFLEDAIKYKKQMDANVMVKNQKKTVGRFFQNMLGGR